MKRFLLATFTLMTAMVCIAQYTQLTNIPTIYIETFGNKAVTSKTNYIYATMTYIDGSKMTQYDSLQIRGRGNSTWNLAKKPYRIKFKESTKFLGKGYAKNKSWTLLANHADKSLLRNAVTFNMGEFLGQPFNPASHFVDLVLNGTYLGNYQVSDQVNVDKNRVEVFEQEEIATDTSNITGGYLIEIDGFGTNEKVNFRTNKNLIVSVKSPDDDIINAAQKDYIKEYINDFESSLFSSSFTDAENGYRATADSATLVSWYLATELSANVDGFWSTYIYKDRDDPKLYFGPLWDYDIAYNNCNRVGDVTNRDMIDAGFGSDLTKVWVKRMIQDPWFNDAVNNAWQQKLDEGLEEFLYNYIDSMATYLDRSQQKNYNRYSISSRVYNEIYLYSTYADYIDQLKRFIDQHIDFLTARFAERADEEGGDDEPIVLRPFELQDGYYYSIYNKGTNKVMDIANQSAEAGAGVVIWSPEYGRDTQMWKIVKVGDYYQLINKGTGMAFNDPSPNSNVGTPLNVAIPDETDERQLWQFITVNENDNYNIVNVYTDHAINNSGGGAADGNNILSYTNDDRNAVSNNRQWRITPEEMIPDYVSDEVKAALVATVEEAQAFLNSLTDVQIGSDMFCYSKEEIDELQQMVDDAIGFESTVADDYILINVKLAEQLETAQKQQLPPSDRMFLIRHKSSGYYLDVVADRLCVTTLEDDDKGQHYTFEATDEGNGVYLKAESGLYVMLGTVNSWTMVGQETITDERKARFEVAVADGHYYLYTVNGLLGTDDVTDNSTVYANKREGYPDEVMRSEWIIEEYVDELAAMKEELDALLEQAKNDLTMVRSSWIGILPFQHTQDRVDALKAAVEEAEEYTYEEESDYQYMINYLTEVMAEFEYLNVPDTDKDYYLRHLSGLNLSCSEGLILDNPDTMDAAQRFRLIPVDDAVNTYNIYVGGMYVSVMNEDGTLALTETPRDEYGQFVVNQVSSTAFTLTNVMGMLGTESVVISAGDPCIGNAINKATNVRWKLEEATSDIDNSIEPHDYRADIDYAVIYDKESETVRFASDDMYGLADVDVQIYTVGGRLLYTFKADERQSLVELPSGTYILRWNIGNIAKSVKLKK